MYISVKKVTRHKNVNLGDKTSQTSEKWHKIVNLGEKNSQTGIKSDKNINLSKKVTRWYI